MHPQVGICGLGKEVCLHVNFSQYIFIVTAYKVLSWKSKVICDKVIGRKLFYVIEELRIHTYIMIINVWGENSLELIVHLTYYLAPSCSMYMF